MEEEMKKELEHLLSDIITDANMALDDTWDRSDDGFVAILENIYDFTNRYKLKTLDKRI